jgi:hypothetical protein
MWAEFMGSSWPLVTLFSVVSLFAGIRVERWRQQRREDRSVADTVVAAYAEEQRRAKRRHGNLSGAEHTRPMSHQ